MRGVPTRLRAAFAGAYGHPRPGLESGVLPVRPGIAFIEYCLAVPANRSGHAVYSTAELMTMQEVITLAVFAVFSYFYLHEPLGWNHAVGFTLIALGAFFVFRCW